MKKKCKFTGYYIGCVCLLAVTACQPDDDTGKSGVKATDKEVNEWIEETMRNNYLWYDEIPDDAKMNYYTAPETFFTSLLSLKDGKDMNGAHHYFSTIEKKEETTKAGSNVNSTYGFEYALGNGISYSSRKINAAWVLYVLPDSPASEAGLKRGDWIVGVNSDTPNITDFTELSSGAAVTLSLGKYSEEEGGLVPDRKIQIAAARDVEDTPFLLDTVYTQYGKRIGYLVYTHFSAARDDNDTKDVTYNTRMKDLFTRFKSQGVEEFVLDLRFNGGGLLTCAQLLSSLLAPSDALGKPFCTTVSNTVRNQRKEYLFLKPDEVRSNNLNLKRLYVLTGQQTASSSEAVINCLIPYMGRANIRLIGMKTLGKTVGSETFGTEDEYGYLLHPITLRIYNAQGKADYENGFAPDEEIKETTFGNTLYPLGDEREYLLGTALSLIRGRSSFAASPAVTKGAAEAPPVRFTYNSLDRKIRNSIIVPPTE